MNKMKIALVGGDGREQGRFLSQVNLRRVAAPKYTGNGRWESFLRSLQPGRWDAVVLLTRWIGHSAAGALKQAAARAGVPVYEVAGGASMAARLVEELVVGAASAPDARSRLSTTDTGGLPRAAAVAGPGVQRPRRGSNETPEPRGARIRWQCLGT